MSRPITPHPVNPARPRPLPGPTQPPRPTTPPPTPTRPGRIVPILGLVAALAAIAVLADVCVMAAAWATTMSLYYIPDSSDWVYALVLFLFALWTGVSVILEPPRRRRRPISRARDSLLPQVATARRAPGQRDGHPSGSRRVNGRPSFGMAPAERGLGFNVRSVRAASGARRSSTSGPATAPGAEGSLGAVAPTPAPIPSPSWRSA